MKKLFMTLAAFSLFASGPAFAGCGSHGGGYSRGYSAPTYSRQQSTPSPRTTAERKVAAKTAKPALAKEVESALAAADSSDVRLPKQAVAAVEALAGTSGLAAEVARECKQYSATIGSLISVACE